MRQGRPAFTALALVVVSSFLMAAPRARAYEFDMVFQTKCIFEEISFETAISGSFRAFNKDHYDQKVPLTIRIEDPVGEEVFSKADVDTVEFHLPSVYEGEYKVCFTAKGKSSAGAIMGLKDACSPS